MGRASRLLRVLVHPSLESLEVIQALRDKGHYVTSTSGTSPGPNGESEVWTFDLILSPTAWRMGLSLAKYIPLAVKSARLTKYGPPSSRKEKNDENPDPD